MKWATIIFTQIRKRKLKYNITLVDVKCSVCDKAALRSTQLLQKVSWVYVIEYYPPLLTFTCQRSSPRLNPCLTRPLFFSRNWIRLRSESRHADFNGGFSRTDTASGISLSRSEFACWTCNGIVLSKCFGHADENRLSHRGELNRPTVGPRTRQVESSVKAHEVTKQSTIYIFQILYFIVIAACYLFFNM